MIEVIRSGSLAKKFRQNSNIRTLTTTISVELVKNYKLEA